MAIEESVDEVVLNQMEVWTSFGADELCFDYSILDRDKTGNRLQLQLTFMRRTDADRLIREAREWGIKPARLDVARTSDGTRLGVDLLRRHSDASIGASYLRYGLGVMAIALAALVVIVPLDQKRERASVLEKEVAGAKSAVKAAEKLRAEMDLLQRDGTFIADLRRRRPLVAQIIEEVSRLVPDNTSLFQLRIAGSRIELAGYSSDSAELIGIFEQSSWFSDAKFRAPITPDSRMRLERFNLGTQLSDRVDLQ
jgi:general secretion pathway protein L